MKAVRFDSPIPLPRGAGTPPASVVSVRGDDDVVSRRFGRTIWSRKWTVILFALLGALGGLTFALQQEPFYRAQTTIEMLPANQAPLPDSANVGYFLQTEVERLRSQNLMRTVIQRLRNSKNNEGSYTPAAWQRLANALSLRRGHPNDLLSLAAQSIQANVVEGSTVVQLQCDSPDPGLAANFLNTLSVTYIDESGGRAQLIDSAELPAKLYDSHAWAKMLASLGVGVLFGLMFVAASDRTDRYFRSPLNASRALGLRLLGVIPSESIDPRERKSGLVKTLKALVRGNHSSTETDKFPLELITFHRKPSLLAESFRSTLSSMFLSETEDDFPQVVLVTSPGVGEGKTTVACNLAVALAEVKKRVLLIDADMRRPRVHSIFDIPNSWGLSDVLADGINLSQFPLDVLVKESRVPRVFVLPSGPAPLSVVTLLHSGRLGALLERLRGHFDAIVVDSPPMLDLGGSRLMSRLANGVVLVVRAASTLRTASAASVQILAQDGTAVLGVVWNDWDPRHDRDGWSCRL
jgi:capsular exopolysaccharide synthesis family protein